MSSRTNTAVWNENQKRWKINVQKDGVRKTFCSGKPGRTGQREANKKADEWLSDPTKECLTVKQAWAEFMKERKEISPADAKKQDAFGRNYFLPKIGKKKVDKVTTKDLQDVLNHAFRNPVDKSKAEQLSRKTLRNFASYEKQFMKFCRLAEWATLFPEGLQIPQASRYCGKRILQVGDLIKLLNISTTLYRGKPVEDEYIYYYRFQVLTGLRPGELRGLRWSDIKGNVCTIRHAINSTGQETKGKNENALRSFVLIPLAMEQLEAQKKYTGELEYIFPMRRMDTYYDRWRAYQKTNGINPPISLYEMRHTFVSIAKSLPEGQLKQLVGHSQSMDTYGTYSHILEHDAEETAEAVQSIFSELLSI